MKCPHCNKEIETDYISIICKELKKEFRIYKWEDKPLENFKFPEGFKWAKHSDVIYLYDNDLLKLEQYPVCYFTDAMSKKNKKNWGVSWLCLYRYLDLYSSNGNLADSDPNSRVVCERELVGDELKLPKVRHSKVRPRIGKSW